MSIVKPYTFVPGTKARANEVNEDFDRLYEQANENITKIAQNATDITNLGIDKANVEGSSTQRFAVGDATGSYDAVNLQTAMKYISNSVNIIGGLTITKDSNSPDDTIIVAPGACYDYEREIVIQLTASMSKKNYDQLGNANYYVYIISDDTGNNPDVLISTSSITPALPAGYTRYRKIGYFKTDSSAKISTIVSFGSNPEAPLTIDVNDSMPDISRRVGSISSGYTAPTAGYIDITIKITGNDPRCYVYYDGVQVAGYSRGGDYGDRFRYTFFGAIAQGCKMTWSFSGGYAETAQFIYCKGA